MDQNNNQLDMSDIKKYSEDLQNLLKNTKGNINKEIVTLVHNLISQVEQKDKKINQLEQEIEFQRQVEVIIEKHMDATVAYSKDLKLRAESASREKSKFLAAMSHEIRTPMNSINGIAEQLLYGFYERIEEISAEIKECKELLDSFIEKGGCEKEMLSEIRNDFVSLLDCLYDEERGIKHFVFQRLAEQLETVEQAGIEQVVVKIKRIFTLLDREERDTIKAYRYIKESGSYLLGLINMILDLSKIESGKIEVHKTEVSLTEFIKSIVVDAINYCRSKNKDTLINIQDVIESNVPDKLHMDKQLTRQVILNLISNAIKFTPRGNVIIRVDLDADSVRFSVKDDGLGIMEQEKNKIFREFGRTSTVKDLEIEGSGLGLVISKRLIELQGGRMNFDSEFGKGSTFWFILPI